MCTGPCYVMKREEGYNCPAYRVSLSPNVIHDDQRKAKDTKRKATRNIILYLNTPN